VTPLLSGMHIGLLTASASRLGGGVFEAVVQQAEMIRAHGGEASVFALGDSFSAEDAPRFAPSPVHHAPISGPAQIGFAPGLVQGLVRAQLDLLHLHGIWMYPSRAGTVWARRTGRPYLVSPHGMLDPWITGRGRAKKAIARIGYERASWLTASAMHALTQREADDIAAESGRSDSFVIPNSGPPARGARRGNDPPHFLYLGRIHPKKNIASLINAWTAQSAALDAAGAKLTIAGWGQDDHVAQLRSQLIGAPASVQFAGPVFGEEKAALMRDARFFVLPSHSEGLPMVVLEAWSAGTPALMTRECNLPEGFAAGAAIDCGFTPDAIGAALARALSIPETGWQAMSAAALRLAGGAFCADTVALKWAENYRWFVHRHRAQSIPA